MTNSDPFMYRLEDQITWYDYKNTSSQRILKRIKIAEIVAAAVIPFLAALASKLILLCYKLDTCLLKDGCDMCASC